MSQTWIASLYRTHSVQTPSPPAEKVASLIRAVEIGSASIETEPYNPRHWIQRAAHYLELNYPELAAGDAYKATLLLSPRGDQGISTEEEIGLPFFSIPRSPSPITKEEKDEQQNLLIKAHTTLAQALYDTHAHTDCLSHWLSLTHNDALPARLRDLARQKSHDLSQLLAQKKAAAAQYGGTEAQRRDRISDGSVVTVLYPWMEERHRVRSDEVLVKVNEELAANETQPAACHVGRSTLAAEGEGDMLGVFATRVVNKGECFLVDRTSTCAVSSPPKQPHCENCYEAPLAKDENMVEAPCCGVLFCSSRCSDAAMRTYHPALCGQDFEWLLEPARGLRENASPLRPLLMLRFLATCASTGDAVHPFDHPLIARLQPLADADHLDVYTLSSLTTPLRILTQLRINIFTSPLASPLVFHALWARLANNKAGTADPALGFIDEITPFLPLFNHSCAPNVEYRKEEGNSTIRFFALRDVRAGEELFDSYLDVEGVGRSERVRALWPWFGSECRCGRCKEEESRSSEI